MELHGWGRYPVIEAPVIGSENLPAITRDAVLSRGLGRAYGDAALPPQGAVRPVALTPRADRILAFDEASGVLRAEAGLSLSTLARIFLPRGFFTPVSPGTQYVTLGGMVASDIHGKNHHDFGTFGRAVRALRMRLADGRILEVTRDAEPELFAATLGGMGLTGHVLEVEVALTRVPTPWIYEESVRYGSLAEVFDNLRAASAGWPMTVAWIDTSVGGKARGRGILNRGRWAEPGEAPKDPPRWGRGIPVPFTFPPGVMNPTTIRWMNAVWWHKHGRAEKHYVVAPHQFFWQLDLATDWYRGYGRRGFTQYQCVMPTDLGVYTAFLDLFHRLGGSSFVTVFKDCGEEGEGMLSFPKKGTTLALDIPIRTIAETATLVRELNAYVLDHGGRVYLAKDAFTTADEFRRMYPRYPEFVAVRDRVDPERRLGSAQSERWMSRCVRRQPVEASRNTDTGLTPVARTRVGDPATATSTRAGSRSQAIRPARPTAPFRGSGAASEVAAG
jgi:FAD/FMN-containing dehydrogenase